MNSRTQAWPEHVLVPRGSEPECIYPQIVGLPPKFTRRNSAISAQLSAEKDERAGWHGVRLTHENVPKETREETRCRSQ